jgi:hypothetical protein
MRILYLIYLLQVGKLNISMSGNVYYTQTFTSDGSTMAHTPETDNDAPYVTYKCKNTVNLNFLMREVLFCDP